MIFPRHEFEYTIWNPDFMRGYQDGYKAAMFEISEYAKERYKTAGVTEATTFTFEVNRKES